MKFNENLKYLRKKENLTQEQLAEKLHISRQAVTKWESGQAMPDLINLKEMSILFGITLDELVGDIENKNNIITLQQKIKDLPFYLLGIGGFLFILFIELGIDSPLVLLFSFLIIFPLLGFLLKSYFNSSREIINLEQTSEGKKERKKIVIQKSIIALIFYTIISIIIYFIQEYKGILHDTPKGLLITIILFWLFDFIFESWIMYDKVKKYNKK